MSGPTTPNFSLSDIVSGTLSALLRLFKQVGGLLLRAGRQQLSVILYAFMSRLPALFLLLQTPAGQCSVPPLDYVVCEKPRAGGYPRASLKSEGAMIHFIN